MDYCFNNIGFNLKNDEDFYELLQLTIERGQKLKNDYGYYCLYSIGNGIDLYVQLDFEETPLYFISYFNGYTKNTVQVIDYFIREHETQLDGSLHARLVNENHLPFIFDLPNSKMNTIEQNEIYDVQLTAYLNSCEVFKDIHEYRTLNNDIEEVKSYIPIGMMNKQVLSSEIIINGVIKIKEEIVNPFTKLSFFHLVVETNGMELDVVTSKELIGLDVQVGQFISGYFTLRGKLI